MKFRKISLLLLLLIFAQGERAFSQTEKWSGNCDITFFGTSTLHNFTGHVKAEPFTVSISDLSDQSKARASGKVSVKAGKMLTGDKKRDAKMYSVLATKTFPNITVEISDLKAAATKPVSGGKVLKPTVIPFTLNLKGKKQHLTGRVTDWSYSDGSISYTVSFPVSLKASGLKVPTVLGFIKVGDEIKVQAKLRLKRK